MKHEKILKQKKFKRRWPQNASSAFKISKGTKPDDYFIIPATSSAKLSSLFSRPSPFSKRTKQTALIWPPNSFGAVFDVLGNRNVAIFDEGLLQKADLFVIFIDSAHHHFLGDIRRFALIDRLLGQNLFLFAISSAGTPALSK